MKTTRKTSRKFLNTPSSGCLGAMGWEITIEPHFHPKKEEKGQMRIDACIYVNDDAKSQSVYRMAHLRPVKALHKELGTFIKEAEAALEKVEKHNEKCK